eukprot:scaffold545020_cov45-Prasinocladus_malaysianus.AAC.1
MASLSFSIGVGGSNAPGNEAPKLLSGTALPASLQAPQLYRQETKSSGHDPCWICFSEEGELEYSCRCPCPVHSVCRAKWQLMKAGTK